MDVKRTTYNELITPRTDWYTYKQETVYEILEAHVEHCQAAKYDTQSHCYKCGEPYNSSFIHCHETSLKLNLLLY